jgi:hypothetical protein
MRYLCSVFPLVPNLDKLSYCNGLESAEGRIPMANKSQESLPKPTLQKPSLSIKGVNGESNSIEDSTSAPLLREPSLYRMLKRWSKLSGFVAFCLNFKGFSRDAVASIYVFLMLGLCIWILISSQFPYAVKGWAAYRLGYGFKEFTKFLTRGNSDS